MAVPAHSVLVREVEHYTPSYFRFRVSRPDAFRFDSGQFTMLGLKLPDGKPLMRAYSIASASWDEELEFYSIIMPNGALTSRLRHIEPGDTLELSEKAVGTLVLHGLRPGGRRLWLLSTGTGVAPFASILRDPETWERFDHVVLTHTCRQVADLAYGERVAEEARSCPLVGEEARERLQLVSSVTREPYRLEGRVTTLIDTGQLFREVGFGPFDPELDRAMICGSTEMLHDLQVRLEAAGLKRGTPRRAGEYVWEKAFTG